MEIKRSESSFTATEEKGRVSAILLRPEGAKWCFAFAHGAALNIRHLSMVANAEAIADTGVAVFRYNFPYAEAGGGGLNGQKVLLETIRKGVAAARQACPDLRLIAGGRSMGGRMTTLAQAEKPLRDVDGLLLLAFPLHQAREPDNARAEHLRDVKVPMLFVSGTRDPLADMSLLRPMVKGLGRRADLKLVETGDHGFQVLKRAGITQAEAWTQVGGYVASWTDALQRPE